MLFKNCKSVEWIQRFNPPPQKKQKQNPKIKNKNTPKFFNLHWRVKRLTPWTVVARKSWSTNTLRNRGASVTGSVIMTRHSNTGTLTCNIKNAFLQNLKIKNENKYDIPSFIVYTHIRKNKMKFEKTLMFPDLYWIHNVQLFYSLILS